MHDLDPDDGQQHKRRQLGGRVSRHVLGIKPQSSSRASPLPGPDEKTTDLSTLSIGELEIEAKREALRAQRLARRTSASGSERERAREELEDQHRIGLFHVLVAAATCAMVVVACGLFQRQTDLVKAGLLALCAICGGGLYQLGPRD